MENGCLDYPSTFGRQTPRLNNTSMETKHIKLEIHVTIHEKKRNESESLGELKKLIEALTHGSCSTAFLPFPNTWLKLWKCFLFLKLLLVLHYGMLYHCHSYCATQTQPSVTILPIQSSRRGGEGPGGVVRNKKNGASSSVYFMLGKLHKFPIFFF